MKPLVASQCLWPNVRRVLDEDHADEQVSIGIVFAVFAGSAESATFCGLATAHDIALHPTWIFADLAQHRASYELQADTDVRHALEIMEHYDREALPVIDRRGRLAGVVTRQSILQGLLLRERNLLDEAVRMHAANAEAEKELDTYRRHLEELVAARTAELVEAKKEAELANSAKSRFLAAASHDLRQPLTAVKLYAGLLKRKLDTKDQPMLVSMEQCVESLCDLLSKLLDLSKLEAGVVEPCERDFALDDVLATMFAAFSPAAEAKGLRLRYRPAGLVARTDPVLFRRILSNLLDNAIHYTQRGGVLVACRHHKARQWVEVWDTGIGVQEDKIDEIFEEFKQLGDGARTRGSGLGLAIAAKTAALLGLEIRVRSRANRGSMFAIEFPLGSTNSVASPPMGRIVTQSKRIGIVEDNPHVLNALVHMMREAGHSVVAAPSGNELLLRLGGYPPDVIVSDYRLAAGKTGFDVISSIRMAFDKNLPAVIITGDTDPALIRSMAKMGIMILHKPLTLEDVLARVDEAMAAILD